jgi:hypothetical protein
MPQNQWSQPSQGWRPKNFQHPALLSPPLQNNTTPNSFPPKKPHLPTQPTPNPSNQQTQPIYNNDTTYQTYSMELQEINIRSGNILQQQPKFIEIEEYDKESITLPQPQDPPYLEILQERKTYTSEEK